MLGVFVLGLLLGGAVTATVLWLLSGLAAPLPPGVRSSAVLAVAVLAVLRDLGWVRVPLPQNGRQVSRDVLARDWLRGAGQFGFELGTGVRTYLSASAPYAVAVALLLASPELVSVALPVGLAFGAGRALAPLLRLASGDGAAWDRRVVARHRSLKVGTATAVATLLLALVFS